MKDIIIFSVGAVSVVLLLVHLAIQHWNEPERVRTRQLQAIPIVPLREVVEGELVRVTGKVKLDHDTALEAPLTGRRCGAFVIQVTQNTHSRKAGIVELIHRIKATDFVIEDETGEALVEVDGAEVILVRDRAEGASGTLKPTVRAQHLLDEHDIEGKGLILQKDLRFREGILAPHEEVTILGQAHRVNASEGGHGSSYRERATRLVFSVGSAGVLTISDDPEAVASAGRASRLGERTEIDP